MKVYFAHPCFSGEQERFKREFLKKLTGRFDQMEEGDEDILIMDPFLNTPNVECNRDLKVAMSEEIKTACLRLLEECEAVVALADGDDTGTAFEAGYAYCMKVPVILVSEATCDTANAMLIGAASARFDNVLDDAQIEELARTLQNLRYAKAGTLPSQAGIP
jgi:nucleoside 2-deoxyribosyltransferase